ncbi:MAG TPA: GerMN domain-containing protein [Nitrospirota bacterium]|nr:GerMN domain-containing protein [Nitrospirota bacterium]
MSWTTDRAIRDNRLLLVIVIGLVFIVAAGAFFYWSHRTSSLVVPRQSEQSQYPLIQPAFHNEPLSVTLYYPQDGMLVASPASVKRQPDAQAQARETLLALFQDQQAVQASVLRDVKLRAFYLDSQGTAYIDLATDQQQAVRASAWDEQLAIYAMVNTLTQNFEEIKQIVFLMNGRETGTLAGHIDLTRKYGKRMDLIRP